MCRTAQMAPSFYRRSEQAEAWHGSTMARRFWETTGAALGGGRCSRSWRASWWSRRRERGTGVVGSVLEYRPEMAEGGVVPGGHGSMLGKRRCLGASWV